MAQVKQTTYTYAEDMTDERQQQVLQFSKEAFEISHSTEFRGDSQYTTIARTIRSRMDQVHGRGWCCVVGRNFGSFVTHQMKTYIYFSVNNVNVLLWKP